MAGGMVEALQGCRAHRQSRPAFLDNTVSSILELDQSTHAMQQYSGNFSDYANQKETECQHRLQTYLDQQTEIHRMQADILRTKAQAAKTEREASSIRKGGPDYKIKGYKSYQQGIAKKGGCQGEIS
jgi:ATPase subunit of ABC transporter with duplicated ATPase domains